MRIIVIICISIFILISCFLVVVIIGSNSYNIYNGKKLSKISGLFINSNRHYFYFNKCSSSDIKIEAQSENFEVLVFDDKFLSPIPQEYGMIGIVVYQANKVIQKFSFLNNTNTNSNTYVFNFRINELHETTCEIKVFLPNEMLITGSDGLLLPKEKNE